jgi:hypothetical protein
VPPRSIFFGEGPIGPGKRLPNIACQVALHVLAYNLTRVMNIVGGRGLIAAIRTAEAPQPESTTGR